MSHANRLVVYAGSSWLRIILGFAVAFVLTPMLVGELGMDLFGLLSLVTFSLALSDPIAGALAKIMTRELTQAKSAGDDARLREVFSNGLALALIAAVIMMLIVSGSRRSHRWSSHSRRRTCSGSGSRFSPRGVWWGRGSCSCRSRTSTSRRIGS